MQDPSVNDRPHADAGETPFDTNSVEWLAAIVESSDDAIIGKTLDSIIRSWNAGATRIFGYQAHEAIGQSVYLIIPPERRHEESTIIARVLNGDRIDHFETVRLRRDGSLVDISLSISPIRDRTGRIIGATKIARDISDAKRLQQAERELTEQLQELATELEHQVEEGQALQEELEQTNEDLTRSLADASSARQLAEEANEAKSQFLATMSHELRTPLNAIAGYAEILELEIHGPLTSEQRRDLARIKRSGQTLLRRIEDVLSFAKIESGRIGFQYEVVRIDDMVAAVEEFVGPQLLQKGLAYQFERCGSELSVVADKDKVEEILINLLSNAVKFTERGRIDLRCMVDDAVFEIAVHDTGRGIEPDVMEAIFEPFVQADRSLTRTAEGTGLGLAISRQLARAMGGDITARSIVDQGSVFTLSLPRRVE